MTRVPDDDPLNYATIYDMLSLIEQHQAELVALCKQYRVQRLDVFGSAVKGTFEPGKSDLDFIVRFDSPGEPHYASRYYYFSEQLQALFQCPTDVVIDQPFVNPYFRQDVEKTRQVIYEIDNPKSVV